MINEYEEKIKDLSDKLKDANENFSKLSDSCAEYHVTLLNEIFKVSCRLDEINRHWLIGRLVKWLIKE